MLQLWRVLLTCFASLQSCSQGTEPSSPIYQVPAAIDQTGATDVTDQLLAFFATVPDKSTISFPANATYRIENTLLLKDRNFLTFEGNGASFVATTDGSAMTPDPVIKGPPGNWPQGRRHWMFFGGQGIKMKNMTIKGANPNAGTGPNGYVAALEAQHGIEFAGVVGAEVSGVTITDVYGDFLTLSNKGSLWCSNIWIHNNTFTRNGRQSIAITGAQDVVIEANDISQVQRATLDIEANTGAGGAKRIAFRKNTIGPGRLNFFSNVGSGNATIEDITIENNTLTGKELNMAVSSPTTTVRRSRYTIRNNTSDFSFGSPSGALMNFYNVDGLVVTGNVNPLDSLRNMVGVRASGSCKVTVTGNQFPGSAGEADILPYPC